VLRDIADTAGKGHGPESGLLRARGTDAGRTLFCVVIEFPDGKGYPITARDMTDKEKRRYAAWKKR